MSSNTKNKDIRRGHRGEYPPYHTRSNGRKNPSRWFRHYPHDGRTGAMFPRVAITSLVENQRKNRSRWLASRCSLRHSLLSLSFCFSVPTIQPFIHIIPTLHSHLLHPSGPWSCSAAAAAWFRGRNPPLAGPPSLRGCTQNGFELLILVALPRVADRSVGRSRVRDSDAKNRSRASNALDCDGSFCIANATINGNGQRDAACLSVGGLSVILPMTRLSPQEQLVTTHPHIDCSQTCTQTHRQIDRLGNPSKQPL